MSSRRVPFSLVMSGALSSRYGPVTWCHAWWNDCESALGSVMIWAANGGGGRDPWNGWTRFLHAHGEQVLELDRPKRAARRHGARSDPLDPIRAAREALGRDQLAQPRAAGQRAAISVRLTARRSAVQAATDAQR
jgi:transposase